jgi:hypothetical protein
MRAISWQAEELLAFQEWLCYAELAYCIVFGTKPLPETYTCMSLFCSPIGSCRYGLTLGKENEWFIFLRKILWCRWQLQLLYVLPSAKSEFRFWRFGSCFRLHHQQMSWQRQVYHCQARDLWRRSISEAFIDDVDVRLRRLDAVEPFIWIRWACSVGDSNRECQKRLCLLAVWYVWHVIRLWR